MIDLPNKMPFGGTLRATVVFTNDSDSAIELDPCPGYRFSFDNDSATGAWIDNELNCAESPRQIAAGQELRFAVELDLPDTPFPGRAQVWVVLGDGRTTRQHSSRLFVP